MELEDVLKQLAESYTQWCKEIYLDLKEEDIANFTSIMQDSLKTLYDEKQPGSLGIIGRESNRKINIEFFIDDSEGIITAWNNTYRVPLEDLKYLKTENIEYLSEERESRWVRAIFITPENAPWIKDIYNQYFKE